MDYSFQYHSILVTYYFLLQLVDLIVIDSNLMMNLKLLKYFLTNYIAYYYIYIKKKNINTNNFIIKY